MAEMTEEIDLTMAIPEITPCETCGISTLRSKPHKSHIQPGEAPMDLIHSDVLGPFKTGLDGSRFIVTFLCDATQLSVAYCIKSKADVFDCFKNFKQHYERPDRRIHRQRADNGGEYTSKAMLRYLFLTGVTPEFTVPGNPQQNGAAEKLGHIIWNKAKTFLKLSGLPWEYWPEMVRTANYVRMRTLQSRLLTTPYRAWYGHDPHYQHMRTPGTKCLALQRLRSKDKDNAVECTLLGYEGDHIYRLVTTTGRLIRASSVQFAAEKRGLNDVGASEPLPKRQHLSTLPAHPVPDLWGDDEIIQVTPSPEREPLLGQAHTPVPPPEREPHPRNAKATTYHPLERALFASTDEPCFIALVANAVTRLISVPG